VNDENRDPLGLENPCEREDLRIALGALALDALGADEARDVRRHLATCPECRAEYSSFLGVKTLMDAGMVGGLARAESRTPAVEVKTPGMPREIGAGPRPRRRLVLAMAGAAASVVLVAAGFFALGQHDGTSAPPVAGGTRVVWVNGYQGISARISFSDAAWGTSISTKMDGVPADYHCTLWAVGKDGSRHNAGSWTSIGSGSFTVPGAADIPASQIDSFVLDLPGPLELTAPVAAVS
jgi:hypothetical protein